MRTAISLVILLIFSSILIAIVCLLLIALSKATLAKDGVVHWDLVVDSSHSL